MTIHRLYSPEVVAFQETQLARLKAMTFHQLAALPRSRKIASPAQIRGIEFRVERRAGEQGGVRIEARACRRSFLVLLSCSGPGFEMLPDGSILLDPDEPPED